MLSHFVDSVTLAERCFDYVCEYCEFDWPGIYEENTVLMRGLLFRVIILM